MPVETPRNLDFMPVLSIQIDSRLKPQQEVYHYMGEVSAKSGETIRREEKSDLGGKIVLLSPNRRTALIEYGHPNPKRSTIINIERSF